MRFVFSQAEAEEAERQTRVSLEIKKSLTHILLHVTDSLFGELLLMENRCLAVACAGPVHHSC